MRVVLDASVALKWVLNEPDSPVASQFRSELRQQLHEILAPDTFLAEIGHALTRAERKGLIQPPQALTFYGDILSTAPDLHSIIPLMPRAIELSSQVRHGVYDCLLIALGEREGCSVLTADDTLAAKFPNIIPLSSL